MSIVVVIELGWLSWKFFKRAGEQNLLRRERQRRARLSRQRTLNALRAQQRARRRR